MLTTDQQIAARLLFVRGLSRNAFTGREIVHGCAYLHHVVVPTIAGGLFALPAPEAAK